MSFEHIKSYTTQQPFQDLTKYDDAVRYVRNPVTFRGGWDITVGDFIDNTSWNDLDWSSIVSDVPEHAVLINLFMVVRDGVVGADIEFRHPDWSSVYSSNNVMVIVANAYHKVNLLVGCESKGGEPTTEVKFTVKPSLWSTLIGTILGWFILV